MDKKSIILGGTVLVAVALMTLKWSSFQVHKKEKSTLFSNAAVLPIPTKTAPPLLDPRNPSVVNVETDQQRIKEEGRKLESQYPEAGKIVELSDGKQALEINGKRIMEAFGFGAHVKFSSGDTLVIARTEKGVSMTNFDVSDDIKDGKSTAASDSLWILTKAGVLERVTPENVSVKGAFLSDNGEKLAFSAIQRDENGFPRQLTLQILDRKTGASKTVYRALSPAESLAPMGWKSESILRVFNDTEHGGVMKIWDVAVD